MKTLLKVQASIYGNGGQSSQLADQFVSQWLANNPGGRIITRDLNAEPAPHLTQERFTALLTAPTERTPEQQAIADYSDTLIGELQSADTIVLAVPMYNFSVPSTIRAYFDHIARAGVTFRYTERGAEGLIRGKQVYVFLARGGLYSAQSDTQTTYLRQFLSFIGLTDANFISAEGLAMGEEARNRGLAQARHVIEELTRVASTAA